jgi:prepilin-type N-terminal cleavage/methylation domain-containing protein
MNKIIIRLSNILSNRQERGMTLVESLVAIAILGGGVLTLVLTMSGGALAVRENEQQAIAQSLARTQLEYTKNCAYEPGATTYPAVSAPEGYSISVGVIAVQGGNGYIQKITANVTRDGAIILKAEDYKVNR